MKRNIVYYPSYLKNNAYSSRMKDILSQLGKVEDISYREYVTSLIKLNFSKKDIVIVNWMENQLINKRGGLSFSGLVKVILKLILLRVKFRTVVYIRHNIYPHSTRKKSIVLMRAMINLIERIATYSVVHSPVFSDTKNIYIPHPLYTFPLDIDNSNYPVKDKDLFVIFGRIARYKKLEYVINSFPDNKKLIIAGVCEDEEYLSELNTISSEHKNIQIMPRFFSDAEAKDLITSSCGMIINHADDDMIVSGSFFYALTLGVTIYSIKTPFLLWAEYELGSDVIRNYSSVGHMMNSLDEIELKNSYGKDTIDKINRLFGDDVILEIVKKMK